MGNNSFNGDSMLEMYLFEASQLLEQLEDISIKCEKDRKINIDEINEIFRIMHTIKSSSAMMNFHNISHLAHSLEDLFYFIRANIDMDVNFETLFDLVLLSIDFIKGEVLKIESGMVSTTSSDSLVLRISKYLSEMKNNYNLDTKNSTKSLTMTSNNVENNCDGKQNPSINKKYLVRLFYEEGCEMENIRAYAFIYNFKELVSEIFYIPEDIEENFDTADFIKTHGFLLCFSTDLSKEEIHNKLNEIVFLRSFELNELEDYPKEIQDLNSFKKFTFQEVDLHPKEKEQFKADEFLNKSIKHQNIISVNTNKLDMLLNLVGEIVISEAMVTKNPDLTGLQMDNFNKACIQLHKLTNELQDIVMSIRMVPVSMTFQKMNRIIRDMSRELNKEVNLEIIGEETELDKNIIDHISDPIMHLVRNALDHGIETKSQRIASGKKEFGKITLEAKNAGNDVLIIVKDDGRGLDRKKIYEKAKKHGLINKLEHELNDKEIFSLIMLPGFSTKEDITEYSGRGVGMDVVKENMDIIGGTISIESIYGEGTTISMKIPLTLAIIDGLEVLIGNSRYMIPITSIKESFKPEKKQVISDSDGNELIMIRGQAYPIYRLHKLFNINTNITKITDGVIVMVEDNSNTVCLFVDSLSGEQQVVVKALPSYIRKVKGIAGCTILGDGNISLILDINEILQK